MSTERPSEPAVAATAPASSRPRVKKRRTEPGRTSLADDLRSELLADLDSPVPVLAVPVPAVPVSAVPATTSAAPAVPATTSAAPVDPATTSATPVDPATTSATPVDPATTSAAPVDPALRDAAPAPAAPVATAGRRSVTARTVRPPRADAAARAGAPTSREPTAATTRRARQTTPGASVAPRPVSVLPLAPSASRSAPHAPSPALVVTFSPLSWSLLPRVSLDRGPTVTFGPFTVTLR